MSALLTYFGQYTHLAMKRSRLSCKDSARWSLRPDPLPFEMGAVPFTFTSPLPVPIVSPDLPFVALPFEGNPFCCGRRRGKLPSKILSNSRGTGGSRVRHISAMERRLRMSAWNT